MKNISFIHIYFRDVTTSHGAAHVRDAGPRKSPESRVD